MSNETLACHNRQPFLRRWYGGDPVRVPQGLSPLRGGLPEKHVNYSINSAAVHAEEEGVVAVKWLNMV